MESLLNNIKLFLQTPNYKIINIDKILNINFATFTTTTFIITLCISIFVIISVIIAIRKPKQYEHLRTCIIWCCLALFVSLPVLLSCTHLHTTAIKHGIEENDKAELTISELLSSIASSPEESQLPDDLTGCIIIYYRFNCEGCETIYSELYEMAKHNPNVYWISSRSEQGLQLRKTYPIQEVPSAIYIYKNYNKDMTQHLYRPLAYSVDEQIVFDKDAFQQLLNLQYQLY